MQQSRLFTLLPEDYAVTPDGMAIDRAGISFYPVPTSPIHLSLAVLSR